MRRWRWALPAVAMLAVVVVVVKGWSPWSRHQVDEKPCPTMAAQSQPASGSSPRVILVVEENRSLSQIIGVGTAPLLNQLARCSVLLTNHVASRHPSLPNYIALLSGDTQGVKSDRESRTFSAPNLVDQLEQAGISWKAYIEGQPRPCWKEAGVGHYVKRHNPFMYFNSIRDSSERCGKVVPFEEFPTDLAAGRLPQFAFITPDLAHDMHGDDRADDRNWPRALAARGQLVAAGDRWLKTQVYEPLVVSSAWNENTRLVVTFDEASKFPTRKKLGIDKRVATIITGPGVLPARDATRYSHYSLLRSIEDLFHLEHLGKTADSATRPIPALAS
jgi:phospholipase C